MIYITNEKTNKELCKMNYKQIVRAIYDKAEKEKSDVRNLIRDWIMLFESSRVVGWNRMLFLDCCVEESKKRQDKVCKERKRRRVK